MDWSKLFHLRVASIQLSNFTEYWASAYRSDTARENPFCLAERDRQFSIVVGRPFLETRCKRFHPCWRLDCGPQKRDDTMSA
jgi:hypothetical protein